VYGQTLCSRRSNARSIAPRILSRMRTKNIIVSKGNEHRVRRGIVFFSKRAKPQIKKALKNIDSLAICISAQTSRWADRNIAQILDRVPEDWIEETPRTAQELSTAKEKNLPEHLRVGANGQRSGSMVIDVCFSFPTPFSVFLPFFFFCLCGVAYGGPPRKSDFLRRLASIELRGSINRDYYFSAFSVIRSLRSRTHNS